MIRNESGVKDHVKRILAKHGIFFFMPAANGYGTVGIADIIAVFEGRFIAIETKFGKNTMTTNQVRFKERVLAAGALHYLIDENDLEWFAKQMEQMCHDADI